ncbi:sigma-70 family RNA polymerase sigma factor [Planctomycetales bacterium ZRK34]|nr:sigma-70 family RNA polymerase sigma factor [Planctomycetales bacterium ZRK34]
MNHLNPSEPPESSGTESFVRLLMAHERQIYNYILALVANTTDADDLMQETATVLWRKFSQFKLGTCFGAWAISIARFEVLKYREGRGSAGRISDAVFTSMTQVAAETVQTSDERYEALSACLDRLSKRDREMIRLRYETHRSTSQIAQQFQRTVSAVYKSLTRIHGQLLECIDRNLRWRERS